MPLLSHKVVVTRPACSLLAPFMDGFMVGPRGGGRNLAGGPDAEIVKWGALGDHPTPHPHEMAQYRAVWGFNII